MKKSYKGSVTVYLSLTIVILIAFVGAILESASIQTMKNIRRDKVGLGMESVFAEYQKVLWEQYHIFAIDATYEDKAFDLENTLSRLEFYAGRNDSSTVERAALLTDFNGQAFFEQAIFYARNKLGLDLFEGVNQEAKWEQEREKADEALSEAERVENKIVEAQAEQNKELPKEDNPMKQVEELKATSILQLVCENKESLSKAVFSAEQASKREKNRGFGEFTSKVSMNDPLLTPLLGVYIVDHFKTALSEDIEEDEDVIRYEMEYLIAGRDSDIRNLEAVVNRIILLRYAANYAYILTDTQKNAEALALAASLTTLFALPGFTEIVKQGILLAWAYGESIMDAKALLAGDKIGIVKTKETWKLQLGNLSSVGQEKVVTEDDDSESGLGYQEYLMILLLLESKENIVARAMDVVEENMQNKFGMEFFKIDQCISKMEVRTISHLRRGIDYEFLTYYGYE